MHLRNTEAGFGLVAQLLHWLIAALVLTQFVFAQLAANASFFERLVILARHKSFGMTILTLAVIPAQAGIHAPLNWTPACAGVTFILQVIYRT